ncbi:MAG: helix-turn-helix domain-containing protein [Sphingobium sp.]
MERKFLLWPTMRGNTYMLTSDVENLTGISPAKLARLRRRGEGPVGLRLGHFYAYRPADVIAWLNDLDAQAGVTRHVA